MANDKRSICAMKASVLLVDDCPAPGDSLAQALRLAGYEVTLVSHGSGALLALRETGFDLVLLDLDKTAGDGWDTFRLIVTNSLLLPLIVITEGPSGQHLAAQQGVAAVLAKPLDRNLLVGVMERVLAETSEARRRRIHTG